MPIVDLVRGPGFFRTLLAGLVVLSHLSNFEIGRPAVFAFFMLSGYWIARMFEEKYKNHPSITVFYTSRFLRIFLAFFAASLIVAVSRTIFLQDVRPEDYLGFVVFGLATHKHDFLGVSWSLDIELQFYLLAPALCLAFGAPRWARLRPFVWPTTLAATALGWVVLLKWEISLVFAFLPSFLIGMWIYYAKIAPSRRAIWASALMFLGIGALVWAWPDARPLLLRNVESPIHEDMFGIAWTALLAPLVAANVRQRSGRFDRWLGDFSYSLYLVHWPTIYYFKIAFAPVPLDIYEQALLLALIPVVAIAFFLIIDRSMEQIRVLLVARRAGVVPAN